MSAFRKSFRLRVRSLDELHCSEGPRLAGTLRAHASDADGTAVIPAAELRSAWREAGRAMISAGQATPEEMRTLLGDEGRPGAVRVTRLRATSAAVLRRNLPGSRQPAGGPIASAGATIETVPADTVFEGAVELRDASGERLLRLLLRRCDALGSGRSSGGGLIEHSLDALPPHTHRRAPGGEPDAYNTRVRLLLEAEEPVRFPRFPDPSAPTEKLLPGRVLRGAFINALREAGAGEAERTRWRRNDLLWSDAPPVPSELTVPDDPVVLYAWDVLPLPLSLSAGPPEPSEQGPWWLSPAPLPITPEHRFAGAVREDDVFVAQRGDGNWLRSRPVTCLMGEPLAEHLAAGTRFLGEVELPDGESAVAFAAAFAPLLSGEQVLNLGRGGAPVRVVAAHWAVPRPPSIEKASGEALWLLLESDLVVPRTDDLLSAELIGRLCGAPMEAERRARTRCGMRRLHVGGGSAGEPFTVARRGSVLQADGAVAKALRGRLARRKTLGPEAHKGFGRFRTDFDAEAMAASISTPVPPLRGDARMARDEDLLRRSAGWVAKCDKPGAPEARRWRVLRAELEGAADAAELTTALSRRESMDSAWARVPVDALRRETERLLKAGKGERKARLFLLSLVERVIDRAETGGRR